LQEQVRRAGGTAPSAGVNPLAALQGAASRPGGVSGELNTGGTARVRAGRLDDLSLTLPRGTSFTCALKTRIVSELSGFVSCQSLRNVYSADGRVLLVERGSHLDGEYTARGKQGQTRIFVVWSRVRTPDGVTIDIDSPATGPLGEAGVDGYVDNHWTQRIGGALLLTLVEDGLKIAAAEAATSDVGTSIVLQGQSQTSSKLAEKVLDSTINIPPTIFKNQGEVVGIYVAKDVDFSTVYELRAAAQ
jgi:type IV secretion system protein VirB10